MDATEERIQKAEDRIKELKLLIQHWGKDNESRSTSSSNSKHTE